MSSPFVLFVSVSNGSSGSSLNGNQLAVAPSTPTVTSTNIPDASPASSGLSVSSEDPVSLGDQKASSVTPDENKQNQVLDAGASDGAVAPPSTSMVIPNANINTFEPFDWKTYMKETNSIPAPPSCFKQVKFF